MFYPDLGTYCQMANHPNVRAIGWLSVEQPFNVGVVDEDARNALEKHISNPWQPVTTAGRHECEFCVKENEKARALAKGRLYMNGKPVRSTTCKSGANVWIPSEEVVYLAPVMVAHYISEHGYCPPLEFLQAVKECPAQHSPEFMQRIERLVGDYYVRER